MTRALLRLYHALPPGARTAAAAARGLYLRHWRYGPETDALVDAALAREQWTAGEWRRWREERLGRLLERAATRVPYYRRQWEQRRRAGDRASWAYLENWPLLPKEAVRTAARDFVADDREPSRMFHEATSGTSGTPLELWWSLRTVREWYALFEARCRRWYGVSRHDRWANGGGQLVVPVQRRLPPFWVWNAPMRQLYLSSYHLAPALVPAYLDAIERYGIRYLWGYSSTLAALADGALATGRRLSGLRVAITNAEPLGASQRARITSAFGCPVRETYGMAEVVAAASECEAGRMHLWPDVGEVEWLAADAADVGARELVCTGLLNLDMPLIRYRVGDYGIPGEATDGATAEATGRCACGRLLPTLGGIEGRIDDTLVLRNGTRVGRLDPVFKHRVAIRGAQIVQERLDLVRVLYLPAPGFGAADVDVVTAGLRERLGDVQVLWTAVEELPRTRSGKVRAVVCALSAAERGEAPVA